MGQPRAPAEPVLRRDAACEVIAWSRIVVAEPALVKLKWLFGMVNRYSAMPLRSLRSNA